LKIRENRLRILKQMIDPDKWYKSDELDAELFLLGRMVEEGLIKVRFDSVGGEYHSYYKLKDSKVVA
jgi:hypothetical protein